VPLRLLWNINHEETKSAKVFLILLRFSFDHRFSPEEAANRKMRDRKMAALIFLSYIFLFGPRNGEQNLRLLCHFVVGFSFFSSFRSPRPE
jgi:hypothetical protein